MSGQAEEGEESLQYKGKIATPFKQSRLHKMTESHILYPAVLIVVLVILWVATLQLIKTNHLSALESATDSAIELANTYEAQVVRAVREIDHTLNVVKRGYEFGSNKPMLALLDNWGLLLPGFLFTTSVTDADGNVTNSTRAFEKINVADQSYFQNNWSWISWSQASPGKTPIPKCGN